MPKVARARTNIQDGSVPKVGGCPCACGREQADFKTDGTVDLEGKAARAAYGWKTGQLA